MRATKQTLALIGGVFVVQLLGGLFGISHSMFAFAFPVIDNPWTVLTNIYAHGGFGHLASNAITLLIVGLLVERVTTTIRFHTFFITTGVLAALAEVTFGLLVVGTPTAVIGASGAIFALMGYALVGNQVVGSVLDSIDLGQKGTFALFIGLAVFVTLMTASDGVALVAHATGFLMGLIAGHFKLLHVTTQNQSQNQG